MRVPYVPAITRVTACHVKRSAAAVPDWSSRVLRRQTRMKRGILWRAARLLPGQEIRTYGGAVGNSLAAAAGWWSYDFSLFWGFSFSFSGFSFFFRLSVVAFVAFVLVYGITRWGIL